MPLVRLLFVKAVCETAEDGFVPREVLWGALHRKCRHLAYHYGHEGYGMGNGEWEFTQLLYASRTRERKMEYLLHRGYAIRR